MREVRIKDTFSGELTSLEAGPKGEVGIYACGPTVYSRIHIGNARPFVVFMLLRRFLEHVGYKPRLAINLTDVNDKIYDAARDRGVESGAHAEEMGAAYIADTAALDLGRPDHEPKATETIAEIVSMIATLVAAGNAYESAGDVYFRVRSFEPYGRLSNREPEAMDQGEEAGSADLKEDQLDFALWKARKEGEDTFWPSPWGDGRPGWHIECSAMAEQIFGSEFAIHGGGIDLVFPHHENEIAQSQAARGVAPARIWMHNGMVETSAAKMAKSVGNIFLLHEAVDRYGPQAVVAFLIGGHYRQPIAFDADALEQAVARNERIRDFFRAERARSGGEADEVAATRERFLAALGEDFNTPRALAELFALIAASNRAPLQGAHELIAELLPLLGLEALAGGEDEPVDPIAEALLREREQAREDRDFERADAIRDELAALGWDVRDTDGGARLLRRE